MSLPLEQMLSNPNRPQFDLQPRESRAQSHDPKSRQILRTSFINIERSTLIVEATAHTLGSKNGVQCPVRYFLLVTPERSLWTLFVFHLAVFDSRIVCKQDDDRERAKLLAAVFVVEYVGGFVCITGCKVFTTPIVYSKRRRVGMTRIFRLHSILRTWRVLRSTHAWPWPSQPPLSHCYVGPPDSWLVPFAGMETYAKLYPEKSSDGVRPVWPKRYQSFSNTERGCRRASWRLCSLFQVWVLTKLVIMRMSMSAGPALGKCSPWFQGWNNSRANAMAPMDWWQLGGMHPSLKKGYCIPSFRTYLLLAPFRTPARTWTSLEISQWDLERDASADTLFPPSRLYSCL